MEAFCLLWEVPHKQHQCTDAFSVSGRNLQPLVPKDSSGILSCLLVSSCTKCDACLCEEQLGKHQVVSERLARDIGSFKGCPYHSSSQGSDGEKRLKAFCVQGEPPCLNLRSERAEVAVAHGDL